MYDSVDTSGNSGGGVKGGVNSGFKITATEVTENGWRVTFTKGKFSSKYLGDLPYLPDEDPSVWPNKNTLWARGLFAFFKMFVPEEQIEATKKEVSAKIVKKLGNEMYANKENVIEAAKFLVKELFKVAEPHIVNTTWNVVFHYELGVDKATAAPKWFLSIPNRYYWQENGQWVSGEYPCTPEGTDPKLKPGLTYDTPPEVAKEQDERMKAHAQHDKQPEPEVKPEVKPQSPTTDW